MGAVGQPNITMASLEVMMKAAMDKGLDFYIDVTIPGQQDIERITNGKFHRSYREDKFYHQCAEEQCHYYRSGKCSYLCEERRR